MIDYKSAKTPDIIADAKGNPEKTKFLKEEGNLNLGFDGGVIREPAQGFFFIGNL